MRQAVYIAGLMLVVVSMAAPASAGIAGSVPEIDGGSLSAGLGLLAGGALMLRARFGRR